MTNFLTQDADSTSNSMLIQCPFCHSYAYARAPLTTYHKNHDPGDLPRQIEIPFACLEEAHRFSLFIGATPRTDADELSVAPWSEAATQRDEHEIDAEEALDDR
jgi:hypothetical protein